MKLSKAQFLDWLDDPVTEVVMQFLRDWNKAWAQAVVDNVMAGHVLGTKEQEVIHAKREVMEDIFNLQYEDIENFYSGDINADSTTS